MFDDDEFSFLSTTKSSFSLSAPGQDHARCVLPAAREGTRAECTPSRDEVWTDVRRLAACAVKMDARQS